MKVLLIEDNANFAFIVEAFLLREANISVERVERLDRAIAALDERAPDVILLDLSLPDSQGLATLSRLRQHSGQIPIIVLTGNRDQESAIEAVRSGAQDYLVKGEFENRGLLRAIRYAIERNNYEQRLLQLHEQTREQAARLDQASLKMQETEHKYRALLESINAIVWESDLVTQRLTFVSKAVESILGNPADGLRLEFDYWIARIHPEDRVFVSNTFAAHLETGQDFDIEHRMIAADGHTVWLRQIVHILKDHAGVPASLRGVTIDISQSKEAERDIHERDFELRSLQESSQKVLETEDVREAIENILDLAMGLSNFDIGVIRLVCPMGNLRHVSFRGYRDPEAIAMIEQPLVIENGDLAGTTVKDVLRKRQPVFLEDIHSVSGLRAAKREGAQSALIIPIATKEESFGILLFGTRRVIEHDPKQVRLLEMLASQIGAVIQKARLYEESRNHLNQLRSIRQFEQTMVSTLDLPDVIKALLDNIESFFSFPVAVSVHLINRESQNFDYVMGRNFDGGKQTIGASTPTGLFAAVLQSEAPIEIPVLEQDPRTTRLEFVRSEGFVSFLGIPLTLKNQPLGVIAIRTRQEHKFSASEINYLCLVTTHAAIAIHNARLYAELEKQSREFSTLYAVTAAASQSLELDQVLRRVVDEITDIFHFDATGLFLLDNSTNEFVVRSGQGSEPFELVRSRSFKKGQSVVGRVAETGEALVFADTRTHPLYDELSQTKIAAQVQHHFLAGFPIKHKGETFGVIMCLGREPRQLTDHELKLIDSISNQIAVAVVNMRLYEQTKDQTEQLIYLATHLESVREQERRLISREIHDELGQTLTALKFDVSWIKGKLSNHQPALADRLAEMSAMIDNTIQAVRKIAARLRPDILDKLGLAAAIEWQLQEFRKRTGIQYHFAADPIDIPLDEQQATTLFRIFQESLTNVARHSHATRVNIDLEQQDAEVFLRVDDDGDGIEADKIIDTQSLGLLGMRERAAALGGNITIQRNHIKGTSVSTHLPLSQVNETTEFAPRRQQL